MAFSLDQFRLDRKVAVVTGAGGRGESIGRAYALGLAEAGAAVVVADLNLAGAETVAEEVRARGGQAIAVGVDIAAPDQVRAMAEAAQSAFGGVDILVNNAALMVDATFKSVTQVPLEDWNRLMAVNATGAMNCVQAIVPSMKARGGGKIVNQVSAGAFPADTLYGVSKLTLVGLTTTLARELGPANINVNAIAPGNVMTEAGMMLAPDDSPFVERLKATVALRARGKPDELVGALLLLCSQAGDWITGQTLHVDGGWIIRP